MLDLGLPGRDGIDVARELHHRSQVPIIMLTARGAEVDRVLGLELGADDYLVKPFSPRELVARVRAVLRRTGAPAAAPAPSRSAMYGSTPDTGATASAAVRSTSRRPSSTF